MTDSTMGGSKPKPIHLTADEERQLREIVASPIWSDWQIRNAEIILGIAAGARVCQLIDRLGYSRATIQRTCRQYEREGIVGLLTRKQRKGRPRTRSLRSSRFV